VSTIDRLAVSIQLTGDGVSLRDASNLLRIAENDADVVASETHLRDGVHRGATATLQPRAISGWTIEVGLTHSTGRFEPAVRCCAQHDVVVPVARKARVG